MKKETIPLDPLVTAELLAENMKGAQEQRGPKALLKQKQLQQQLSNEIDSHSKAVALIAPLGQGGLDMIRYREDPGSEYDML